MIENENILFLLKDERLCKSKNMQAFFRTDEGKKMSNHLEVIRWHKDGALWFAILGFLVRIGNENGFAGVEVRRAAAMGAEAKKYIGYPSAQKGGDYDIVTDWFWDKYRERGVVSLPEIWNVKIPLQLTHAESHQL